MSSALTVDWCSYEAAKYAVMRWHYSHSMPSGKLARFGVWEYDRFVGTVIYGSGANNNIGKPYALRTSQVCELVRVALVSHNSPVTRIVAITLRMLKDRYEGLRLSVSYADPRQGHLGGIYQGGNWIYVGESGEWKGSHYIIGGRRMHGRSVRAKWGHENNIPVTWSYDTGTRKHKYLMPLDKEMRKQLEPLAKPYPKRAKHSADAVAIHATEGGSIPTRTLQEVQHAAQS